jgi:hypothetical protein
MPFGMPLPNVKISRAGKRNIDDRFIDKAIPAQKSDWIRDDRTHVRGQGHWCISRRTHPMNGTIASVDAVIFIADLLNSSPVERRNGDEFIWVWDKAGDASVYVVGTPSTVPIVFVDISELEGGELDGVRHFAIIGWCVSGPGRRIN